jgi:serine/threonine protein phosphatase 1
MKEIKKLFVVSDVHGHCGILKKALQNAGFENENPNHLLVCCGDYFDRGVENAQVLEFFENINRKVLLRGNHEDLLLKVLQTGKMQPHNYINGTRQTLKSFFENYSINEADDTVDFGGKAETIERVCRFIESTLNYFETENYLFVHGWLPENAKTLEQIRNATDDEWVAARKVLWTNKYNGIRPLTHKTLVCGHMPTFYANKVDPTRAEGNADIFAKDGFIAIDAGTDDSHQINVLVLEEKI